MHEFLVVYDFVIYILKISHKVVLLRISFRISNLHFYFAMVVDSQPQT